MRSSFVTGLETWFTLPGAPGAVPPPPYKMALLTWITIFPLMCLSPRIHPRACTSGPAESRRSGG
jgi:antibiotic biosynthesis monooxygenase (ABM) superfamily enzyme